MRNGNRDPVAAAQIRRLRVLSRWAVISFVGVAMAAFLVFDVLDLDGSNLRRPFTGSLATTDAPPNETERFLVRAASGSSVPGAEPAVLPPVVLRQVVGPLARVTLQSPRTHQAIAHRGARNDHALRHADPTADDPA